MGPGSGPSMDRVILKNGGTGAVKQLRHVLVPPAFAQRHAVRMHLAAELYPPAQMSNAQMRRLAQHLKLECVMWESMMRTHMSLSWKSSQDWTCSTPSGLHRRIRRVRPWQCGATTSQVTVVITLLWANGTTTGRRHCTLIMYLQCHLAQSRNHRSLTVPC